MADRNLYSRCCMFQAKGLFLGLILAGSFFFITTSSALADSNQVSSCCTLGGDVTGDGRVNIEDIMYLVYYTFSGGPAPTCFDAADVTGDSTSNITDIMYIVTYVFAGGPAPVCPTFSTGGASSDALIDSALTNGTIDYETSLIYRVYALYNDSRLPAIYRGDDSGIRENNVELEISRNWNQLSVATQDLVGPYVVNPIYEGSWLNQGVAGARSLDSLWCKPWKDTCSISPDWYYIDSNNGLVRVWYNRAFMATDEAKAIAVAAAIDNAIYPKLTGLMGKVPLSDAGFINNGGNGRMDITLMPGLTDVYGYTTSIPGILSTCTNFPPLIKVDRGLTGGILLATVTHEVMHAILFAFPAGCYFEQYAWMHEATATWSEHYVYPAFNSEHEYTWLYMYQTNWPLDWNPEKGSKKAGLFKYSTYLFFFYLQQISANFIPAIWNASTSPDPLSAIESGLQSAGGTNLEERWPEFALRNWNTAPFDQYKQWDNIKEKAYEYNIDVALNGASEGRFEIEKSEVNYLTARYTHFYFVDDDISFVSFVNGQMFDVSTATSSDGVWYYKAVARPAAETKGLKIQMLYKLSGQDWALRDVTDEANVIFCRDRLDGRVEELVFIFSNSSIDRDRSIKPADRNPLLYVSNTGCWEWSGEVKVVENGCEVTTLTANVDWTTLMSPIFNLRLGPLDEFAMLQTGIPFTPSSGVFSWKVSGGCGDCVVSGSKSWPVLGPEPNLMLVYPGAFGGPYHRGIDFGDLTPGLTATASEHVVCPDDTFDNPLWIISLNSNTEAPEGKIHLSADGKQITGSYDDGSGTVTTINLTAVRE